MSILLGLSFDFDKLGKGLLVVFMVEISTVTYAQGATAVSSVFEEALLYHSEHRKSSNETGR